MSKLKHYTNTIRNLERMVVELSPYMTDYEVDRCVGFCHTVGTSKFDTNPSVEDSGVKVPNPTVNSICLDRHLELISIFQMEIFHPVISKFVLIHRISLS